MLGRVVSGLRTWMCTIAAPALAASSADCAICAGVTGTAGLRPGVSAEPVTAHEIITFRCMLPPGLDVDRWGKRTARMGPKHRGSNEGRLGQAHCGGLIRVPHKLAFAADLRRIVHCAKPRAPVLGTNPNCGKGD